jgi:hypothetical protein
MTDIRVTQAGRQAITQEDADVRVTQAGRQVAVVTEADLRVTMLGRQVLAGGAVADLRVTMLGRQLLMAEPRPSRPLILTPFEDAILDTLLYITYTESTDPLGGDVTYTCRYKLLTDTVWTYPFTDREGYDYYSHDISEDADGDYEFELWSETIGYQSVTSTTTFTVHNGIPTAPVITSPGPGEELTQTTNSLEWEDATDPEGDPLTYNAQYRLVAAETWTPLFTDDTSPYSWNMTALAVGEYEVQVVANDGIGDGPPGFQFFSVSILDRPVAPALSVVNFSTTELEVAIREYSHPQSRAWQATRYEIIAWGGDWSNKTFDVTTTDADFQLGYLFEGMIPGFQGVVRATFQDDANTWGDPSPEVWFYLPGATGEWERRFARDGEWFPGGRGQFYSKSRYKCCMYPFTNFSLPQYTDAIVPLDSEELGSAIISGYVGMVGQGYNFGKVDLELREIGVGLFKGNDDAPEGKRGIWGMLRTSTAHVYLPIPGIFNATVLLKGILTPTQYPWTDKIYQAGTSGQIFTAVEFGGAPNPYGIPIGQFGWGTPSYMGWYKVILWIQRDIAAQSTRIRLKVEDAKNVAGGTWWDDPAPNEWHVDYTLPRLTPCGQPGFHFAEDGAAMEQGQHHYYGLEYTALRDLNQDVVVNIPADAPWVPDGPGACQPVTEDALAAPVFFPAPPNGDVKEDIAYLSDVIQARDDTEQRISLHEDPVRMVSWRCTMPTSREVSHLKGLIYDQQPDRWGVPMWMDAAELLEPLSQSAGTIPASAFDPATRRFGEVGYVAIWTDQFTWDLHPATLEADGSITLSGTLSRDYAAHHTYVLPVRIGRMSDRIEFPRSAPFIADLEVEFVLETIDG